MKITVLIEDTEGNSDLPAEHGLSLYIETENRRLIMDTGASDLTWKNASSLGIDISKTDTVVISHGHYDHAGGLPAFSKSYPDADVYIRSTAFGEFYHGDKYIGVNPDIRSINGLHYVNQDGIHDLGDGISLFSGITGRKYWPQSNRELVVRSNGIFVQDCFDHEQCLTVSEGERTLLVSGCAHNGILNILDRFYELYGRYPHTVISGFHMMKKTAYTVDELDTIIKTAQALVKLPVTFYTGHCTGQAAFDIMKPIMSDDLNMIHTGDTIIM